jgi:uncharacterized membrane protein required for colicin V production
VKDLPFFLLFGKGTVFIFLKEPEGGEDLIWLDWLIIAVLGFSAFQGFRCGLVSSVAKLAGILLGFGMGITYNRDLAAYLNKQWDIEDKILPLTDKTLKFFFPAKTAAAPALSAGGELAAAQLNPYSLLNPYSDSLATSFTTVILNAICFLALIAITVWAVNLAGHVLTRIAKASPLGPLNHIGGLIFGGVKGIIIVMILLTLMSPFQRTDLLPGNSAGSSPVGSGAFSKSKVLPYFAPLFKAMERPLPGVTPLKPDQNNTLKSV